MAQRPPSCLIAILGATGAGKSTFINEASGKTVMDVGHSQQSQTSTVQGVEFEMGGIRVKLFDTPGFNDQNLSDTEVLQILADWLQIHYSFDLKLTGIIYIHDITQPRMSGSAGRNLQMFRKLCGDKGMKNVTMVTTKWELLQDTATGDAREKELIEGYTHRDTGKWTRGFWSDMLKLGAGYRRAMKPHGNPADIVRGLLREHTFTPMLQKELAQGSTLLDTAAGQTINSELRELEKKMQKELKQRLSEASAESDERIRKIQQKNAEDLQKKIKKAEEDMEALNKSRQEEMNKMREELERQARENGMDPGEFLLKSLYYVPRYLVKAGAQKLGRWMTSFGARLLDD